MATILAVDHVIATLAPTAVTLSGEVLDAGGGPARRKVTAYNDLDLSRALAQTESSPVDGSFSLSVHGISTSKYTVMVSGENDENHQVFAHVSVS